MSLNLHSTNMFNASNINNQGQTNNQNNQGQATVSEQPLHGVVLLLDINNTNGS